MAWSVHTWKILRIFQSRFLSGEVRAETRHSSYTNTLPPIQKNIALNEKTSDFVNWFEYYFV